MLGIDNKMASKMESLSHSICIPGSTAAAHRKAHEGRRPPLWPCVMLHFKRALDSKSLWNLSSLSLTNLPCDLSHSASLEAEMSSLRTLSILELPASLALKKSVPQFPHLLEKF